MTVQDDLTNGFIDAIERCLDDGMEPPFRVTLLFRDGALYRLRVGARGGELEVGELEVGELERGPETWPAVVTFQAGSRTKQFAVSEY